MLILNSVNSNNTKHCHVQYSERYFPPLVSPCELSKWEYLSKRMWKIKVYSSVWAQYDGHILLYTDYSVKNVVSYPRVVQAERCYNWFLTLTWQGNTLSNLALLSSLTHKHSLIILKCLVCPGIIWFIMRLGSHAFCSPCNS